mmetsp:Transcript_41130/g.80683  ORF Transcript_41130/g.80683 Transcript_41130/m.80683 type:complete len:1690 (-) Transcript_41130:48-5117(-)
MLNVSACGLFASVMAKAFCNLPKKQKLSATAKNKSNKGKTAPPKKSSKKKTKENSEEKAEPVDTATLAPSSLAALTKPAAASPLLSPPTSATPKPHPFFGGKKTAEKAATKTDKVFSLFAKPTSTKQGKPVSLPEEKDVQTTVKGKAKAKGKAGKSVAQEIAAEQAKAAPEEKKITESNPYAHLPKSEFFMSDTEKKKHRAQKREQKFLEKIAREKEERLRLIKEKGKDATVTEGSFYAPRKFDRTKPTPTSSAANVELPEPIFPWISHVSFHPLPDSTSTSPTNTSTSNSRSSTGRRLGRYQQLLTSAHCSGTDIATCTAKTASKASKEAGWQSRCVPLPPCIALPPRPTAVPNPLLDDGTPIDPSDITMFLQSPRVLELVSCVNTCFPALSSQVIAKNYRRTLLHRLQCLKTDRLKEAHRRQKLEAEKDAETLAREARLKRRETQKVEDQEEQAGSKDTKMSEGEHAGMDSLWTEKYKAFSTNEVCGNAGQVFSLSDWLKSWSEKSKKGKTTEDDSDSDFNDYFDDPDEDVAAGPTNVVLLNGPFGIGKTLSVYTCAKQTGYKVLEINACQRRGATEIMKICGEATQSHRLSLEPTKESQLHSSKKIKKKDKQAVKKKVATSSNASKAGAVNKKNTLILFEEIDNVFDEDKGFLLAIRSLVRTAKRPLLMTANSLPDWFDSDTMMVLDFKHPPEEAVLMRLLLICLAEGGFMPLAAMQNLLHQLTCLLLCFHNDVRKVLMCLHLCFQSTPLTDILKPPSKKVKSGPVTDNSCLLHKVLGIQPVVPALTDLLFTSRGQPSPSSKSSAATSSCEELEACCSVLEAVVAAGLSPVHHNYLEGCQRGTSHFEDGEADRLLSVLKLHAPEEKSKETEAKEIIDDTVVVDSNSHSTTATITTSTASSADDTANISNSSKATNTDDTADTNSQANFTSVSSPDGTNNTSSLEVPAQVQPASEDDDGEEGYNGLVTAEDDDFPETYRRTSARVSARAQRRENANLAAKQARETRKRVSEEEERAQAQALAALMAQFRPTITDLLRSKNPQFLFPKQLQDSDDSGEFDSDSESSPIKRTQAKSSRKRGRPRGRNKKRVPIEDDEEETASAVEGDTTCTACGSGSDPHQILLCDRCPKEYHMKCLPQPLLSPPEGDWFCPSCCAETPEESGPEVSVQDREVPGHKKQKTSESKVEQILQKAENKENLGDTEKEETLGNTKNELILEALELGKQNLSEKNFGALDERKDRSQNEMFSIESIRAKRKAHGIVEFLIKWEGYSEEENTWEPRANLVRQGHQSLINKYENEKGEREKEPEKFATAEGEAVTMPQGPGVSISCTKPVQVESIVAEDLSSTSEAAPSSSQDESKTFAPDKEHASLNFAVVATDIPEDEPWEGLLGIPLPAKHTSSGITEGSSDNPKKNFSNSETKALEMLEALAEVADCVSLSDVLCQTRTAGLTLPCRTAQVGRYNSTKLHFTRGWENLLQGSQVYAKGAAGSMACDCIDWLQLSFGELDNVEDVSSQAVSKRGRPAGLSVVSLESQNEALPVAVEFCSENLDPRAGLYRSTSIEIAASIQILSLWQLQSLPFPCASNLASEIPLLSLLFPYFSEEDRCTKARAHSDIAIALGVKAHHPQSSVFMQEYLPALQVMHDVEQCHKASQTRRTRRGRHYLDPWLSEKLLAVLQNPFPKAQLLQSA